MARIPVLRRSGRTRDQRGAVAVEFALIVPLLLLLVFGVIEFSFMMNRDLIVGNTSRDAARVASLGGTYTDVCTAARNGLSQSGIPAPAANTCAGSGNQAQVVICVKTNDTTPCTVNMNATAYDAAAESGKAVFVRVTYTYNWITPVIGSLFGDNTTLGQSTEMRVE